MKEADGPAGNNMRYLSLRVKLLIGFTLLFSLLFAAAFYWFYQFATEQAITRITDDLIHTMKAAVAGIDGDQLQALYEESLTLADGATNDPRYEEQIQWLETVHEIEPRATLYTYIPGDKPNEFVRLTSYGPGQSAQDAAFSEPLSVNDTEAMSRGMAATTLLTKARTGCIYRTEDCVLEPYERGGGHWVSAFTPVRDSSGDVVAGLGVEFEASDARIVQDSIRARVGIAFLLTYPISIALVYFLSRFFARPIVTLTRLAENIGEGAYDESLKGLGKTSSYQLFADETTRLSEVFRLMVSKVVQREQLLRKQVEDLRIEIDVTRRQTDVGNIVETDFFRDLQQKARDMRKRAQPPELAEEHLPDSTESSSG